MTAPFELSVVEQAAAIRDGRLTAAALVESCLGRIDASEGDIQAWVTVDRSGALEAAPRLDAEARAGRFRGPLHGVPVGLKDIIHAAGLKTTSGARGFADALPRSDAPCVARLRAAGAVILGKLQTTEFAFSDPAVTRNPWDPARTPGGSSAGSAAAVAARMVPAALGSQTVGSVLRPRGLLRRRRLQADLRASQPARRRPAGVVARPRGHLRAHGGGRGALVVSVLAGHDPADPGSAALPASRYVCRGRGRVPERAPRLGLIGEPFLGRATPEARAHLDEVARALAGAAARASRRCGFPPLMAQISPPSSRCPWRRGRRDPRGLAPATRARPTGRGSARGSSSGQCIPADVYLRAQRIRRQARTETGPAPGSLRRARHALGPRAGPRPEHDRRRRVQRSVDRARRSDRLAADRARAGWPAPGHSAHRGSVRGGSPSGRRALGRGDSGLRQLPRRPGVDRRGAGSLAPSPGPSEANEPGGACARAWGDVSRHPGVALASDRPLFRCQGRRGSAEE